MAREMSSAEIETFLSSGTRTASLATTMADGSPHVMPIWFVLEGGQIVFNTAVTSVKGRNLRRDARVALVVDEAVPPYAFVHIRGHAELSEEPDELLASATAIAARYMGHDRAGEYGRRNGVPGEYVVRVIADRVIAQTDVAD